MYVYIYIYIYTYITVACKFILLLIWKFLKQNKNLEIKKKRDLTILTISSISAFGIISFCCITQTRA